MQPVVDGHHDQAQRVLAGSETEESDRSAPSTNQMSRMVEDSYRQLIQPNVMARAASP